ncbi:MAG: hypothetical protein ABIT61_09560 [Steroidobacteraceae bacterium]
MYKQMNSEFTPKLFSLIKAGFGGSPEKGLLTAFVAGRIVSP